MNFESCIVASLCPPLPALPVPELRTCSRLHMPGVVHFLRLPAGMSRPEFVMRAETHFGLMAEAIGDMPVPGAYWAWLGMVPRWEGAAAAGQGPDAGPGMLRAPAPDPRPGLASGPVLARTPAFAAVSNDAPLSPRGAGLTARDGGAAAGHLRLVPGRAP